MIENENIIKKLVEIHNRQLDDKVDNAIYLKRKIQKSFESQEVTLPFLEKLNLQVKRGVTATVFLFLLFTALNLVLIKYIDHRKAASQRDVPEIQVFAAVVPGSITSAYSEVMK
jgi:hypothetical protein